MVVLANATVWFAHACSFDANYKARFGVYAPEITRSRLEAVYATKATFAGILLGNGWCNYLLQVRCWENTIGIVLANAGKSCATFLGNYDP